MVHVVVTAGTLFENFHLVRELQDITLLTKIFIHAPAPTLFYNDDSNIQLPRERQNENINIIININNNVNLLILYPKDFKLKTYIFKKKKDLQNLYPY